MRKILISAGAGCVFVLSLFVLIKNPVTSHDFVEISYEALPGWDRDEHRAALHSFQKSCIVLLSLSPSKPLSPPKLGGTAGDWTEACQRASRFIEPATDQAARQYFEQNFTILSYREDTEGLFTGYFAPEYEGSETPSKDYPYPLYAVPDDLKILDLGKFRRDLKGKTIIGEVKGGEFVPYKDRKDIDKGALENKQLELVWLKDPADAFFLHIQGSGVIRYNNGNRQLFGYAGKNGKAYHAIGKFLIQSGEISREDMSMQAIRQWVSDHPLQATALMWKNPSYVFFRPLSEDAPVGAMNVPLTPGRSLAVDRQYVPLGMPVWLDLAPSSDAVDPIRRLVVAQDTGGAIKGRVRADVYWGMGEDAGLMAGPMKDLGRYYFLVPNKLAQQVLTVTERFSGS